METSHHWLSQPFALKTKTWQTSSSRNHNVDALVVEDTTYSHILQIHCKFDDVADTINITTNTHTYMYQDHSMQVYKLHIDCTVELWAHH